MNEFFKDDPVVSKMEKHVEETLRSWILENLNGTNISDLRILVSKVVEGEQNRDSLKNDLLILCDVTSHLNLELLNMFDNYLCFDGPDDQTHLKRLCNMATARAKAALAARNTTHSSLLENILNQISKKLRESYANEDRKIAIQENSLSGEVQKEILKNYEDQIHTYIEASNIDEYHANLVQYSLGILDRVLDFSAKMNGSHAKTSSWLEAELNNKFLTLKQKHSFKPKKPVTKFKCAPSLQSKVARESTRGLIQYEVMMYQKMINDQWQNQKNFKALEILHKHIKKEIGNNLSTENTLLMQLQIERYFSHNCNHFEIEKSKNGISGKCLAIYFCDGEVHMAGVTKSGVGWNLDSSSVEFCADSPETKLSIPNLIQHIELQNKKKGKKIRNHIVMLLKSYKGVAESKADSVGQICVIIPAWFQSREISEFREMALKAGFQRTYCVRESCAVVYALVRGSSPIYETCVVFTAHIFNINIDIFQIKSHKAVQLVGLAACDCSSDDKLAKTDRAGSGILQKLNEMFETALSFLDEQIRHTEKGCLFVSYDSSLQQVFDSFFRDTDRRLNMLPYPSKEVLNLTMVSLATNPKLVTSKIIDYVSYALPSSGLGKKSVSSPRTDNLLEKCRLIRQQLQIGSVRLGVLMGKLVSQSLEQAESVANDNTASENDILEQCAKIDGIIRKHKFTIFL